MLRRFELMRIFVELVVWGFCSQSDIYREPSIEGADTDVDEIFGDGASVAIGKLDGSDEFGKEDEEWKRSVSSDLKSLDDGEKCGSSLENRSYLEFLNIMLAANAYSVDNLLRKWTNECKGIGHGEIYMAALQLQKRRMHVKALKAYINAQSPAYGFLDRMKAENVSPNKSFAVKLARANAFMYKEDHQQEIVWKFHVNMMKNLDQLALMAGWKINPSYANEITHMIRMPWLQKMHASS